MDFSKRAAGARVPTEQRATAVKDERKERKTEITTTTTTQVAPVAVEAVPITTVQPAIVDVVARAPVVEETIIQETKESIHFFFISRFSHFLFRKSKCS
jgi:hypothetical protein